MLSNENLNPARFAKVSNITMTAAYDYKYGRSVPSSANLYNILNAFPIYTCYLLDLDPKEFSKQIIFKE